MIRFQEMAYGTGVEMTLRISHNSEFRFEEESLMPSWIRKTIAPGDRVIVEIQHSNRSAVRPLIGLLRTVEVIDGGRAVIFNEDGTRYAVDGRTLPPVALGEVSIFADPATGGLWALVYRGNPELVSVMAYRDYPELIDWLSLRAVKLVDANGNYLAQSLGEVVEVLSDWRQDDNEDPRVLAPGEAPLARHLRSFDRKCSWHGRGCIGRWYCWECSL
jgi:hypothetical protein